MADEQAQKRPPPRASRRKRRGHSSASSNTASAGALDPAIDASVSETSAPRRRAVKSVRQLDPEAFKQVDSMIGSFAQRRFGQLMPKVAEGFFGNASEDERKHATLQQAFALYFVYGYRDAQGLRVIDMFSRFGLKLDREQKRVLEACLRACQCVCVIESKNPANKQLQCRDLLRGVPMTVLDRGAFDLFEPGDVLIAYMFTVGDMWRPLGMVTKVARGRTKALSQGLSQLAQRQGFAPSQLADRRPAQVFWTAIRIAERTLTAKL